MTPLAHGRIPPRPTLRISLLALVVAAGLGAPLAAQAPADQAATLLLTSARRAYNEKNYAFAAARFREFAGKYGGHKEAPSARYGLALCLIEGTDRNYNEAIQNLQPLAGNKSLPDHPFALYYLGHCQRALGVHELSLGAARPQELPQRRAAANQRFDDASKHYAAAVQAFTDRARKPAENVKELPLDLEWAARARCDQAEMYLRLSKAREGQAAVAPFLADGQLVKSRYRRLALYYHGFGSFLLTDYLAAGKSLNQLAPFTDPAFGTHARYLLARILQAGGERAEAAGHYEGLLAQHARQIKEAQEALRNPQAFQNNPAEKARLTSLATAPPPDHVARATLYLGVLQYEGGHFAEALTRFADFQKQFPTSSLLPEAQLRAGFCQVQLKQFADAVKTLQPIADKQPILADQALLWIARAQASAADPANANAWLQEQKKAVDTLRRAGDLVRANDPATRGRRGQILLEMADVQQAANMYKEAAATCNQVLSEKLLPGREEEVLQRQASALHLAGDYVESDKVCVRFRDTHGKSPLLPAVLFRHAENAAFAALAAEKNANLPNRVQKLAELREETIKRYQVVIDRFPEFAYVNLARYGLAMGHYRKGDVEKARDILDAIPLADRNGELVAVNYALADCFIRLAPHDADDALAAGKLTEQMNKAAELLSAFVGAAPQSPQTPDALLKLGFCHQRLAEVSAQPPEKAKALAAARAAYEQLMQKYPQSPLQPTAVFERARVLAQANDVNGALNELRRFTNPPLKNAAVAAMANLRLATLLRGQNKAAEAANVLAACRQAHEANLQKDPARAAWVPLLQVHHGLALKEAGKLPEARQLFDGVVRQFPKAPEAIEAALRNGQCLKDEGLLKVAEARKWLAQPGRKPEQLAQDRRLMDDGFKLLGEAVAYLERQAEQLKQQKADTPVRARMLYDATWAARALAEQQVASARDKLREERWQKLKDAAARKAQGQTPPYVAAPAVPLSDVPLQEAEKKTRSLYQALLSGFPDLESTTDARFELAELYSDRGEHDSATKLLKEALDREPGPELTEKIKLRLGVCLAARGDVKDALAQFEAVARNDKSPLRAQAVYRAGECLMQAKDFTGAVKHLAMFRDFGPFQNVPGVTDRALLRLGHALGQLKQWDASRQVHEQSANRFPQGPWVHEARYGIGWAHQNKGEYDAAVNAYNQVAGALATELGARAQLNVGLCRLAQKRYAEASTALLVVPFTYDYPELNAAALLEAARALAENKERDRAIKLLKRLLRDHPEGESAEAARKRLEELQKG